MPSPASVQAASPASTGTSGSSTVVIPPIPARMMTSPVRTRRRPGQLALSWAWIQAPTVQASVEPVTATPASTGLWCRSTVMVSVT